MALNLKNKFAVDTTKLVQGAKLDLGEGAYFMVARWGNKAHSEVLEKLRAPYQDRLDLGGKLTDDEAENLMVKAMAESILVGWGGLCGVLDSADDKEIPYSVENAEALLRDKELEELRARIFTFSTNAANYRKAAQVAVEKNSVSSSSGKKVTAKT